MTTRTLPRLGGRATATMRSPLGPCMHDREPNAANCVFCLRDRLVGLVQAVRDCYPDHAFRFEERERAMDNDPDPEEEDPPR